MKSINITSEDVYKQLVAGKSKESVGEAIASDLNDLLDEAYDRYDAYIATQKATTEKRNAMKNMYKAISDYAKLNGDNSLSDLSDTLDEMSDDEMKSLTRLLDMVFEASKPTPKARKEEKKAKNDDTVLKDFLDALFN